MTDTDRLAFTSAKPLFVVVSPTVGEGVRAAGGLMFDRAFRGWRVVLATPDGQDLRALRILGVRACGIGADVLVHARSPWLRGLALPGRLWADDGRWRREAARDRHGAPLDLKLWRDGDRDEDRSGAGTTPTAQAISFAARAFKTRALAVLGDRMSGCADAELFERYDSLAR